MARKRRRASTRRRRTTRRRAIKKRASRSITSNWKKISTAAGVLAGVQQLTNKDMTHTAGMPIATKAQAFINSIVGRTTGYNPFPAASGGQIPQTINPNGMFNKWSGIGAASLLYSVIPVKMLPHRSKAKTLGKAMLTGGILGGLFDAPTSPRSNLLSQSHSSPIIESAGVT
jgi:hypothetical protein